MRLAITRTLIGVVLLLINALVKLQMILSGTIPSQIDETIDKLTEDAISKEDKKDVK